MKTEMQVTKGDEEIEHDNALKTLQFMKVSTMVHAHQYEVVDHVNAHEEKKTIVPTRHQVTESREAESRCCCCAAGNRTRVVRLTVRNDNRSGTR